MSEPALYDTPPSPLDPHTHCRYADHFTTNNFVYSTPYPRQPSFYSAHLHRGASTSSLRDLRHHHSEFSPHSDHPEWKQEVDHHHNFLDNRGDGFDEPISPLQPNFSGGLTGSPSSGMPYSPISENPYGPSPPGTGTSTSSSVPPLSAGSCIPCSPSLSIAQHLQRSLSTPNIAETVAVDRKTYSFVSLPGNAVKKRPRRRYDEIERLYQCSWPECTKAYGTLNHLNAHVTMQKHGPKRTPDEFKEMRKQWRKAKKEQAATSVAIHRGDSYGEAFDDPVGYNHHYLSQHVPHSLHHISRPHNLQNGVGFHASSVGIAEERSFNASIDDIRYPPSNERDDSTERGYDSMVSRQRHSHCLPASWHGSSALSRSNSQHHQHQHHQHQGPYGSSSVPQHAHHSHLPHLSINANMTRSLSPPRHSAPVQTHDHPASISINRCLPSNGALLTTPLSGYHAETSSLMPPLQIGGGTPGVIYTSESYELHDSDSAGRPGTGHTTVSVS